MPVVVGIFVVPFHHKAVVGKLQPLFEYPLTDHLDGEAVQFANRLVKSACGGVLGYLLQTLAEDFLIGGIHTLYAKRIQAVALLVGLGCCGELLPVLRHGSDDRLVVPQLACLGLQLELRFTPALVERLAFPFERGDALF